MVTERAKVTGEGGRTLALSFWTTSGLNCQRTAN
jgi:hypothetical protein